MPRIPSETIPPWEILPRYKCRKYCPITPPSAPGIRKGDLILSVGGQQVGDKYLLAATLAKNLPAKPKSKSSAIIIAFPSLSISPSQPTPRREIIEGGKTTTEDTEFTEKKYREEFFAFSL